MSKRLQVVMDDAEYQEIQDAAAAERLTASAWVRAVLREAREGSGDASAPSEPPSTPADPSADADPSVLTRDDRALIEAVMRRHGFASARDAILYALRRAAEPPLLRQQMLELRGMGWPGDLDRMR